MRVLLENLARVERDAVRRHDLWMLNIALALLVFVLALSSDFFNTRYIQAVHERNARRAAMYSVLVWLISVGGLVTIITVGWWLLVPEGAGFYAGTLVAMRRASLPTT